MSVVKLVPGKHSNPDALKKAINYCAGENIDFEKCDVWNGYGVMRTSIEAAIASMLVIKRLNFSNYEKQLIHVVMSLCKRKGVKNKKEYEMAVEQEKRIALLLGEDVSLMMCERGFQTCYFEHIDSEFLHLHFVINSVNFVNGSIIKNSNAVKREIKRFVKEQYPFMHWV